MPKRLYAGWLVALWAAVAAAQPPNEGPSPPPGKSKDAEREKEVRVSGHRGVAGTRRHVKRSAGKNGTTGG